MKMNPAWIAARHCGRPSPDNEREESGQKRLRKMVANIKRFIWNSVNNLCIKGNCDDV